MSALSDPWEYLEFTKKKKNVFLDMKREKKNPGGIRALSDDNNAVKKFNGCQIV